MSKLRTIALCWLIFIFAFFSGWYVYDSKIWPYGPLMEIKAFLKGGSAENLSLMDKITNDMNLKPSRHIKVDEGGPGDWLDFTKGHVSSEHWELKGLSLSKRRQNPRIFLSPQAPDGFRVIYGTFDFDNHLHGAIMLDSKGNVAHEWQTSQEEAGSGGTPKDTNVFPHGFVIGPDGSIVVAYDEGNSLEKYDYCGRLLWRIKGHYNHSIDFEGQNAIWVWKDKGEGEGWRDLMVKVDYNTGKILKEIPLYKIMDANPDIDIFAIRQEDGKKSSTWVGDFWHPNDIEPLPRELESHYPGFKAGNLLVSLRSVNLIFIVDQDTLKVKWWREGLARRQHDPDWNKKGTITIFNNNMHRAYSNIMELNPFTYAHHIAVDGETYNFYTYWRGKHQMMPHGGFLISSPDQGRVFETDANGNVTFEFLNTYHGNKERLAVSEAVFLPNDYFKELPTCP